MTQLRLANVILGTTDLDRAVGFYHEVLGLDLAGRTGGFAFLDAGGVTVTLSEAHAGLATPVAGAIEVVLAVSGVREAHAELEGRGVTFMNQPRNVTGSDWAANFRDPDGHLLSIFGPEHAT